MILRSVNLSSVIFFDFPVWPDEAHPVIVFHFLSQIGFRAVVKEIDKSAVIPIGVVSPVEIERLFVGLDFEKVVFCIRPAVFFFRNSRLKLLNASQNLARFN